MGVLMYGRTGQRCAWADRSMHVGGNEVKGMWDGWK